MVEMGITLDIVRFIIGILIRNLNYGNYDY